MNKETKRKWRLMVFGCPVAAIILACTLGYLKNGDHLPEMSWSTVAFQALVLAFFPFVMMVVLVVGGTLAAIILNPLLRWVDSITAQTEIPSDENHTAARKDSP